MVGSHRAFLHASPPGDTLGNDRFCRRRTGAALSPPRRTEREDDDKIALLGRQSRVRVALDLLINRQRRAGSRSIPRCSENIMVSCQLCDRASFRVTTALDFLLFLFSLSLSLSLSLFSPTPRWGCSRRAFSIYPADTTTPLYDSLSASSKADCAMIGERAMIGSFL